MGPAVTFARQLLDHSYQMLADNLAGLTLAEALFTPAGGYRSILGTIKHAAAWSHVYHSYAFALEPRHWAELDWPRGLRDRVETTEEYLAEVIAWLDLSHREWQESLAMRTDAGLERPHPLHWGASASLSRIVIIIATHHVYHAGEINQLLAIARGEAWEDGEEVEENHISTIGHRVRPPWRT